MKMKMKKIMSLVIVLALSISMVACTSGDASLHDAFIKMQDVTTIETRTDIGFELSGEGLGEFETMQLNQMAPLVNGMKLGLSGISTGNKEATAAKSELEVSVEMMGMIIPIKMWGDIDLDNSQMKMIYEIPELLMGMMAVDPMAADIDNPLMGKDYIVYDMAKVMEIDGQELDYGAMMDFQKEFQPKTIEFMENIQNDLKLDEDIIKLEEEKEVDGEKIIVYRVHLNDESLREVVKDLVNYMLENEATREFILDYMDGYMEAMESMGLNDQLTEEEMKEFNEEMEDFEENLEENLADFKADFEEFMEEYKDIKILGEEGINILYSVNEEGYIVEEDGVMDFSIDLAQFADQEGEAEDSNDMDTSDEDDFYNMMYAEPEMKGRINFKINYNTKNTNINNEDLEVTMPELTEENSIDMDELMEAQMEQLERQMEMMEEYEDMYDDEYEDIYLEEYEEVDPETGE